MALTAGIDQTGFWITRHSAGERRKTAVGWERAFSLAAQPVASDPELSVVRGHQRRDLPCI